MKYLIFILAIFPLLSHAKVEINTEIFKVIETKSESGKITLDWVKDQAIAPGEKVGYLIKFINVGNESASGIVLSNPIPEHTFYVDGSARGANSQIEFSVNDGQLFGSAEKVFIEKDGKKRLALPKEYTNVRWIISNDLAVGEIGSVQYVVEIK